MGTPNAHRGAYSAQPPSTFNPATPLRSRADSFAATEPRSDSLRKALEATRAKREASERGPDTPSIATPTHLKTLTRTASDPWLDHAREEQESAKTTPARRTRRPSEGAHPRMRSRDREKETDTIKNNIWDLSLKLELLRKQNNDLKDQVDEREKRIEQLEPLQERNRELQAQNERLTADLGDLEDEVIELREQNGEILKIQEDTVEAMEKTTAGLQEAAEIIDRLEQDKNSLATENAHLRAQAATQRIDGVMSNRFPARLYSVDEARPSTSNFDSDYYSQPDSPHVISSKESLRSVTVSNRVEKFRSMKKETQRSTHDLKKRVSDASMRQKRKKDLKLEPKPQVPPIPKAYLSYTPTSGPSHTPKRVPSVRATPVSLSPALAISHYPSLQASSAPHTPIETRDGLHAMYRNDLSLETPTHGSGPTSSAKSPLAHKSHSRSVAPVAPPRESSRAAPTSYSAEKLRQASSSEAMKGTQLQAGTEAEVGSERDAMTPTSSVSDELTTELDAQIGAPWWNSMRPWGTKDKSNVLAPYAPTDDHRSPKDTKSMPYMETNLLFNPTENEDDFIERTRSIGSLGRRKR